MAAGILTSAGAGVIYLIISIIFYFIPSIIAFHKSHLSKGAILALNFFLGWTLLGWVAALVWSLKYDPEKSTKIIAEAVEANTNENNVEAIPSSTAEELSKLAELKEKGILSEEEFQSAKSKVLKNY